MDDAWFTGLADELAQCLLDAEACAGACEELLEDLRNAPGNETKDDVVLALVVPAAVARVLAELIDQPPHIVLATCRLFRESAANAVEELESLGKTTGTTGAVAALRTSLASCGRMLAAAE